MAAPDFNTLLEEAKCYICLGISQAEALELALLARISAAGGGGSSIYPEGTLVYQAILTQSGTNAPVATVMNNTIGNIVWSYFDVGVYNGTLANAFPAGKTLLLQNVPSSPRGVLFACERASSSLIEVTSSSFSVNFGTEDAGWVGEDNNLGNFFCLQILVFP